MNSSPQLFLSADNITIRVYDQFFFSNTSWQMHDGEQWLILGENGSGKSVFAKAIAGLLPLKNGRIICHFGKGYHEVLKKDIAYLSFETQQKTISDENYLLDLTAGFGDIKEKTVKEYLGTHKDFSLKNIFDIKSLFNRRLATLSTGEMRKVFLIKILMKNPKLLILDEPFDGLDFKSKGILMKTINVLMKKIQVILIIHNEKEIPENITHILLMKNCRIFQQGKKKEILQKHFSKENLPKVSKSHVAARRGRELISMKNVSVEYDGKKILDNISWTVRKGENWAILGHNGAGKSTLMHLITGDNQQAYSNKIILFGKEKGTGETVWDIKKHIGIISTDLMLKYDKKISSYSVILSGFFDSIGLYKKATEVQEKKAKEWIKKLDLQKLTRKNFYQLSFGQKRLILIARAVVKSPELLILDEPCHGLDLKNKQLVLETINKIGNLHSTSVILITHNEQEIAPCITNKLILENGKIVI